MEDALLQRTVACVEGSCKAPQRRCIVYVCEWLSQQSWSKRNRILKVRQRHTRRTNENDLNAPTYAPPLLSPTLVQPTMWTSRVKDPSFSGWPSSFTQISFEKIDEGARLCGTLRGFASSCFLDCRDERAFVRLNVLTASSSCQ